MRRTQPSLVFNQNMKNALGCVIMFTLTPEYQIHFEHFADVVRPEPRM